MECPIQARQSLEALLDYCAGKLDAEAAAVLERHLRHCETCSAWVASQRAVQEALETWEPAAVSRDFDRRLYARIAEEERPHWWQPLGLRPAFSLALASVIALAVVLVRSPEPAHFTRQAQVEPLDAERLELVLQDLEMLSEFSLAAPGEPREM